MKKEDIEERIRTIVHHIIRNNDSLDDMVFIGIRTGGAFLASRIRKLIKEITKKYLPLGVLDITLYRDDWTRIAPAPIVRKTDIPFPVDDKIVILIDDVLFTGRTVRAAMDAILDYGRPKKIKLAILIDRGKRARELPICADYVGETLETSPNETINVYFEEQGYEDMVAIERVRSE
jgi:pyrimidine operon attenuation protein/uracil phosphoribosyltransferase